MVEQLISRTRQTFPMTSHPLVVESRCILCSEVADPESEDHIFPRCAYRKHPVVFAGIIGSLDNQAPLCNCHHHDVDRNNRAKMDAFKYYDLIGLVSFVALDYPKSPDQRIRIVQFEQWKRLFTKIGYQIASLNGDSIPLYNNTKLLVDYFVDRWRIKSDF